MMNIIGLFAAALVSMAFTPSDYSSSETYLDEVVLVTSSDPIFNYFYGTSTTDRNDPSLVIDSGDILVPTYARWNYEGTYPVLESIDYYVGHISSSLRNNMGFYYGISYIYNSSSLSCIVGEYNYSLCDSYGMSSVLVGYSDLDSRSFNRYGHVQVINSEINLTQSYSTGRFNSADFLDAISPWVWYITTLYSNDSTAAARQQGYDAGYDFGYGVGKSEGYEQGVQDTGEGGIIANLFGGVLTIPISILNGLTPLVIWDVPIISIILTFLIVGTVIFIIKRFV